MIIETVRRGKMIILICDDQPEEAAALETLLGNISNGVKAITFSKGLDALEYVKAGKKADICILDIIMPGMSGIELAKEMRNSGYPGEIVFLSASNEFGPESYEVGAFRYLLKPPGRERVEELLKDLTGKWKKDDTAAIHLVVPGAVLSVRHSQVLYVEVVMRKCIFRLRDGKETVVKQALKNIEQTLLGDTRFAKCHRSYIVNLDEIAEISDANIVMNGGARIPLARTHRKVINQYFRRRFGEG
jgi:DNA-binding LytR/AlgR family response regulator